MVTFYLSHKQHTVVKEGEIQVNKPIFKYFFTYLFFCQSYQSLKIVNRDSYSRNDSINLTTLQLENSTGKKPFPALASVFLSALREVFSQMVFSPISQIFQTTSFCSTCSINDTVVGCNKLILLSLRSYRRQSIKMGSDLFFVELTLRVFQNGLSVVGRLFVDIINMLSYFTVLKSVKVVIATC